MHLAVTFARRVHLLRKVSGEACKVTLHDNAKFSPLKICMGTLVVTPVVTLVPSYYRDNLYISSVSPGAGVKTSPTKNSDLKCSKGAPNSYCCIVASQRLRSCFKGKIIGEWDIGVEYYITYKAPEIRRILASSSFNNIERDSISRLTV